MAEQAHLKVHLLPGSSRNDLAGWREDALCVKVTAPPVENAANRALLEFLADLLRLKKNQVEIVSGHKSRDKLIRMQDIGQADLDSRVRALVANG